MGSLVAALASYLDARHHRGQWLLRIENLDPPREPASSIPRILESLEAHALAPDEPVLMQASRIAAYQSRIQQLQSTDRVYPCACSRRELRENHNLHPRHCRQNPGVRLNQPHALRFKVNAATERWHDRLLGPQSYQLEGEPDDPVILRKDGFFAYQLAAVTDDIDQGITHVVRGSDLLDCTPIQLQIYRAFDQPAPQWLHIPVLLNDRGDKLSKQTKAPALDDRQPARNLWLALDRLGQQPPTSLQTATPEQILEWAVAHWNTGQLPLTSPRV